MKNTKKNVKQMLNDIGRMTKREYGASGLMPEELDQEIILINPKDCTERQSATVTDLIRDIRLEGSSFIDVIKLGDKMYVMAPCVQGCHICFIDVDDRERSTKIFSAEAEAYSRLDGTKKGDFGLN